MGGMDIEIKFFETTDGKQPLRDWIDGLDTPTIIRIVAGIARMAGGNFGDSKPVGEGVSERRFGFGPGYRVYYAMDGQQIVILLVGGTKKRQQRDIEMAKQFWNDYKKNKRKKGQ